MSALLKPETQPETKPQEPEPFTVKCSATKPERALINGGLIVVTIPINAMNRVMILGFMYDSLHYVTSLLDMIDANKAKHQKPSLADGVAEALASGIDKIKGALK